MLILTTLVDVYNLYVRLFELHGHRFVVLSYTKTVENVNTCIYIVARTQEIDCLKLYKYK